MAAGWVISSIVRVAATTLAITLTTSVGVAQKGHDPLSSAQVDQVRELGDHPVERLKLFLKFANERVEAIKELTPDATENDRPAQLRARYEEFMRIVDELSDNIDTYDTDHADIRKALRAIVDSYPKWNPILQAPPSDRTYDFVRKTALNAAESASDQVGKVLASEETYFASHKDQVNGNGKAPTPEP